MKCNICEKDFPDSCFYILKNGYIDHVCKECRCAKCSDDKPWTFFTIMMYYDIPYIEKEWLTLMKHQVKKTISNKTPYTTIFGQYLSKMKLASFKNYSFYDSAALNHNFQKNWYDRNLFLDDNVASYLEILTKERDFNE